MPKIGLQMYTMRNHTQTPEAYTDTLKRVSEIGYRTLQTTTPAFLTPEENAKLLRSFGLRADSVLRTADVVTEQAEEAAKEAEIYGCDVLRTTSIPDTYIKKGKDGYKEFAEIMNKSGEACKKVGLKYMYHFHAFEWITFGDTRGIDILLNETDPSSVYFFPDVFWLTNAGTEPSVSLKMFKDRAFTMHVKDYAIMPLNGVIESVPFNFAPVGTGNLNWDGILKSAKEIGIETFVVEQDMCDGDAFDAISVSFNNLIKMGLER